MRMPKLDLSQRKLLTKHRLFRTFLLRLPVKKNTSLIIKITMYTHKKYDYLDNRQHGILQHYYS